MNDVTLRRAALLDRDGTLIHDAHYAADASRIRLLPGAAAAVAQLNKAGVLAIIVTNQSGIGRGLITPEQYEATRARTEALLLEEGALISASFHCPHAPPTSPPEAPCDCRKPGTGLHREAARQFALDLRNSLFVGDRRRDVEPAFEFSGFGVLVPGPNTPEEDFEWARAHAYVAPTLGVAVEHYLSG